jgi:hypothetical protein
MGISSVILVVVSCVQTDGLNDFDRRSAGLRTRLKKLLPVSSGWELVCRFNQMRDISTISLTVMSILYFKS